MSPSEPALAAEPPVIEASEPAPPPGPIDLTAYVAAKLCHDFISPTGAISSGLDLLADPSAQDMREEAMSLIAASARKLVGIVHFARVAFGAATSAESFDARELETLVRGAFEHMRAELEWRVDVGTFNKPQARALLNLAQIGGGALPTGGAAVVTARAYGETLEMEVDSRGPRARLKAEVATGLRGETLTEGLAGQWIQAYWLHQVVDEAGGRLSVEIAEEHVRLRIEIPA